MTSASTSLGESKVPSVAPSVRRYPKPVWLSILLARYVRGYWRYLTTGLTPYEASLDLRRLYRLTNGRFNDLVARLDSILHPSRGLPSGQGVLGQIDEESLARITGDLRREGFHQFDVRLSEDFCTRLRSFAEVAPCRLCPAPVSQRDLVTYDSTNPIGTLYKVDQQALHENIDIQTLATDGSLLSVAQAYLRCRPVFLGCCMWWSTAFSDEASSEAAQLYHFDMDHVKFLKIFVYLTDVDEDQGPHVMVRNTHRRKSGAFLDDRRYSDEEILAHYSADRIVSIAGPAGTMFAEDTSGFHKASPVNRGHRLLLQLQYATSGFGSPLRPVVINDRFAADFVKMTDRYPRIYAARFRRPHSDRGSLNKGEAIRGDRRHGQ